MTDFVVQNSREEKRSELPGLSEAAVKQLPDKRMYQTLNAEAFSRASKKERDGLMSSYYQAKKALK